MLLLGQVQRSFASLYTIERTRRHRNSFETKAGELKKRKGQKETITEPAGIKRRGDQSIKRDHCTAWTKETSKTGEVNEKTRNLTLINDNSKRNKTRRRLSKTATDTNIVLSLFVGTGIEQQAHTIHVTIFSGTHQRRPFALRVGFVAATTQHQSHCAQNESGLKKMHSQIEVK